MSKVHDLFDNFYVLFFFYVLEGKLDIDARLQMICYTERRVQEWLGIPVCSWYWLGCSSLMSLRSEVQKSS